MHTIQSLDAIVTTCLKDLEILNRRVDERQKWVRSNVIWAADYSKAGNTDEYQKCLDEIRINNRKILKLVKKRKYLLETIDRVEQLKKEFGDNEIPYTAYTWVRGSSEK